MYKCISNETKNEQFKQFAYTPDLIKYKSFNIKK